MHILNFIMDFHSNFLKKIYAWNYSVFRCVFDIMLKFFLFPMGYEVVYHKLWNMRLETLYQFKGVVSLYNTLLIFLFRPSKFLPTTSWPMDYHCVFLLMHSSSKHTFNNSIPQLWQSPMIQLLLWNSTVSSLEHNIQLHIEINVLYVWKWVL